MNGKRRLIGSFNHGSMANAMLQAIGAQAAFPARQVISMSGDGGFTMMMGDFISLTPARPAGEGGRAQQRHAGLRRDGDEGERLPRHRLRPQEPRTSPPWPRRWAFKGIRVEESAASSKAALREALAHDGPALVDVVSARQELVMPPKTTLDQAPHFGLFMLKAVMDGRATQVIDLARTNLRI